MTVSLFRGERIALRPFEPDDQPALAAYLNHPELAGRRGIPWGMPEESPLSRAQVARCLERWASAERSLPLVVTLAAGGELVGHYEANWEWDPHCPSVELCIDPARWRQGLGSEALQVLLRYLFGMTPAHVVSCWLAEWNEAGLAFARRHGFRDGGRMRRAGFRHGRPFDVIITDLLRAEWQQGGGQHGA